MQISQRHMCFGLKRIRIQYSLSCSYSRLPGPLKCTLLIYSHSEVNLNSFRKDHASRRFVCTHLPRRSDERIASWNCSELCFWLFLVGAGPTQHDWFHSRYSKLWMGGSVVALVYVPLITILNRSNPFKVSHVLIFRNDVCSCNHLWKVRSTDLPGRKLW